MNDIKKEELFTNLKTFLKTKGIEIHDGPYADGIRKGCEILTDTVNMSQRAFDRAKDAVGKSLDEVRQTVHEKTAPKDKPTNRPRSTTTDTGKTRTHSTTAKTPTQKTKTATSRTKKSRK